MTEMQAAELIGVLAAIRNSLAFIQIALIFFVVFYVASHVFGAK